MIFPEISKLREIFFFLKISSILIIQLFQDHTFAMDAIDLDGDRFREADVTNVLCFGHRRHGGKALLVIDAIATEGIDGEV